jgi:hypothetical protein
MIQRLYAGFKPVTVIVVLPILLMGGCASVASQARPTIPPTQPYLTALALPVRISRTTDQETSLQKDETVSIQVNDRIKVPEKGHGLLRFSDLLVIDILRDSEFAVSEIKPEPGNAVFVILTQVKGHSRLALNASANVRVKLETNFATITTQRPGTEFVICHDPTAITCLTVFKGEVEVVGKDKGYTVRTLKEGEATYILKGQPPVPPICADVNAARAWLDKKLGVEPILALGEVVASWKQIPCSTTAQMSSTSVPHLKVW